MTTETKIEETKFCTKIAEFVAGKSNFTGMSIAREYNQANRTTIDWHKFSYLFNQMRANGELKFVGVNDNGNVIYTS